VSVPLVIQQAKRMRRVILPSVTPPAQWRTQEFCSGGVQQIQLRTEDRDLGGGIPLVRGSGGNCNFVQEISFLIVKSS